jgi:hypothetical protein
MWDAVSRLRQSVCWSVGALHARRVSARNRTRGLSFKGPNSGSQWRLNWDSREDEGKQSSLLLPLPPLCADWSVVFGVVVAGTELHSSSCLAEILEFVFWTSLVIVHISLNWLWHFSQRIPPIRFLHPSWIRCRTWSAASGLSPVSLSSLWANVYGILTTQASQTSMDLYWAGVFRIKEFCNHFLPITYVCNIRQQCVKCTCLIGAPIILADLGSVAMQWIRK